ncbi:hypothetical protein GCM10027290_30210 [Micromonospora sonneratiae]|uniref:Uncharacterized protein n=1 Tax=Micromonospora sonneratiae TaxID=1184706 RepID=A0ABW3YAD9_9ACTN
MTEEAQLKKPRFEPVHVELDWYDGPQAGLADVDGVVHYFHTVHYAVGDSEPDDDYYVWPASDVAVAWEREQWAIFVDWNARYEAGTTEVESHPGHGGVDSRYDELTELLAPCRMIPDGARRLTAEWQWLSGSTRYHIEGVDYRVNWRESQGSASPTSTSR